MNNQRYLLTLLHNQPRDSVEIEINFLMFNCSRKQCFSFVFANNVCWQPRMARDCDRRRMHNAIVIHNAPHDFRTHFTLVFLKKKHGRSISTDVGLQAFLSPVLGSGTLAKNQCYRDWITICSCNLHKHFEFYSVSVLWKWANLEDSLKWTTPIFNLTLTCTSNWVDFLITPQRYLM